MLAHTFFGLISPLFGFDRPPYQRKLRLLVFTKLSLGPISVNSFVDLLPPRLLLTRLVQTGNAAEEDWISLFRFFPLIGGTLLGLAVH